MEILPFLSDGRPSRLEIRWHVGALKLAALGPDFVRLLEGMGRLDVSLRAASSRLFDGIFESATWDASVLIDYETLSSLWVTGVHELLRTVDYHRRDNGGADETLRVLRNRFERVSEPATVRAELADLLLDHLDALPHTPASMTVESRWLPLAS
ncbi:MAG TPA: hypothetical protein VGI92_08350 [Gemmatimonadales bacterium]|jgi:hypothetical protein